MKTDSDPYVLVVSDDTIPDIRTQVVTIRRFLRGMMMSTDILIAKESRYNFLKDRPRPIYRHRPLAPVGAGFFCLKYNCSSMILRGVL